MPADQFGGQASQNIGKREPTLFGRKTSVEDDLENDITEFVGKVVDRLIGGIADLAIAGFRQRLDRFHQLRSFFGHEAGERTMGLLTVPRTLGPQFAHDLFEMSGGAPEGDAEPWNPERREMVGHHAIKLIPRNDFDVFVRKAETGDNGDGLRGLIVKSQLNRRKDVGRMTLRDEKRPVIAGHVDGESVTVDDAGTLVERIHAKTNPGKIDKRQCR